MFNVWSFLLLLILLLPMLFWGLICQSYLPVPIRYGNLNRYTYIPGSTSQLANRNGIQIIITTSLILNHRRYYLYWLFKSSHLCLELQLISLSWHICILYRLLIDDVILKRHLSFLHLLQQLTLSLCTLYPPKMMMINR